jgi:pimeloyl-ACP methyl ester carboxylesterase
MNLAFLVYAQVAMAAPSVSGTVFLDRNANGSRDAGEPGIPGVVVSDQVHAVVTDSAGRFKLMPSPGHTLVFVSVPDGYRAVGPFWKTLADSPAFPLAVRASPREFSFIHASDTHLDSASLPRMQHLQAVIDSIRPDFVLITGDLVRDALRVPDSVATSRYQLFARERGRITRPVWTVPGNHEIFGIERRRSGVSASHPLYARGMYRHYFGPDYYSFTYGGVHFIGLNSVDYDDESYYGHVDSVQMTWLKEDLSYVPAATPVVTFNHIPFVTAVEMINGYDEESVAPTVIAVGGKKQFRHVVANAGDVIELLRTHRFPLALGGHMHVRETLRYALGGQDTRFEQAGAVVGPSDAAGLHFQSGVTLYHVRAGQVDSGQFIAFPDPPEDGAPSSSSASPWTDSSRHKVSFVETAPGVRLEVLDWGGSGPPLVFLPGLGNTAHAFDNFAPRFTDHYRVIAMTRRGFGVSSHPDSGYDAHTLTEDLVHVLDAMHIDRANLAGHSIARIELTGMAVHHANRVRKLIYLDAAYGLPGEDSLGQQLFATEIPGRPTPVGPGEDSSKVETYVSFVHRSRGVNIPESDIRARYAADGWNEDLGKGFRAILRDYVTPQYAAIREPVLAIYATQDSISQEEPWVRADTAGYPATREAERRFHEYTQFVHAQMARVVPSARIEVIHGGHHWVFVSHADWVERLMRDFLR